MDMNICDLKRGDKAIVLKVEHGGELKERLISQRVYAGAKISVLKVSLFKHIYLIQAGNGKVAMEREVASGVHVWRI